MSNSNVVSLETFAALAAQRGLKMEPDMLERQYIGYCNLQELLARLPSKPDPATDPALVFVGDKTEIGQ